MHFIFINIIFFFTLNSLFHYIFSFSCFYKKDNFCMPFKSKENEIFLIVSIKNIKNVKVWKEVYKYNCFVRIYYLENKFKCYNEYKKQLHI